MLYARSPPFVFNTNITNILLLFRLIHSDDELYQSLLISISPSNLLTALRKDKDDKGTERPPRYPFSSVLSSFYLPLTPPCVLGLTLALRILVLLLSKKEATSRVYSAIDSIVQEGVRVTTMGLQKRAIKALAVDSNHQEQEQQQPFELLLEADNLKILKTINRQLKCSVMSLMLRAETRTEEDDAGAFLKFLVETIRDGDEQEHMTAVTTLLELLPEPQSMGHAIQQRAHRALLCSLTVQKEHNKQLLESVERVLDVYREKIPIRQSMKTNQSQILSEIELLETGIVDAEALKQIVALNKQAQNVYDQLSEAQDVISEGQERLTELARFLQQNHQKLQAVCMALSIMVYKSPAVAQDTVTKLSFVDLVAMVTANPFNLAIHYAVLHLMLAYLTSSYKNIDKTELAKSGLLPHLASLAKQAVAISTPNTRVDEDTDTTPTDIWCIYAAEERRQVVASGKQFELCKNCLHHVFSLIYSYANNHPHVCVEMRRNGLLDSLCKLSGLHPDSSPNMSKTLPTSCDYCSHSHPFIHDSYGDAYHQWLTLQGHVEAIDVAVECIR